MYVLLSVMNTIIFKTRHSTWFNYRSPALGGGLMTMTKEFFLKTGKYDEEMEIWGPDNVELSLRVWFIHSCVRSFNYSFVHSFMCSFVRSLVRFVLTTTKWKYFVVLQCNSLSKYEVFFITASQPHNLVIFKYFLKNLPDKKKNRVLAKHIWTNFINHQLSISLDMDVWWLHGGSPLFSCGPCLPGFVPILLGWGRG